MAASNIFYRSLKQRLAIGRKYLTADVSSGWSVDGDIDRAAVVSWRNRTHRAAGEPEGIRGKGLNREAAFGHVLNVQDAIDISGAAKAEESVLGKHDIDLGIGEWHVSRLLRNYVYRCLRRYYGVDRQCCAIGWNHVVVQRAETGKAAWIESPQSEWTARYHLGNRIETVGVRGGGSKRHVVTENLDLSVRRRSSIQERDAAGDYACTRQSYRDRNHLSIASHSAVYIREDAAIAWVMSAHRKCADWNVGDGHPAAGVSEPGEGEEAP